MNTPPAQLARTRAWKERNRERIREYNRQYQLENRGAQTAKRREYRERFPEKMRAHNAVAYALRAGRLTRPDRCERCDMNGRAPEAHHADYYRPLDVEWLCDTCHRREHGHL